MLSDQINREIVTYKRFIELVNMYGYFIQWIWENYELPIEFAREGATMEPTMEASSRRENRGRNQYVKYEAQTFSIDQCSIYIHQLESV